MPNDQGVAHFGLALRERVPANTVLAAGWLGGPAYYSGLPAIDLFGKTDKHIARITPTRAFRPGHNKVDYGYSIGTLRPDVVFMGLDEPEVESYGYVRVRQGLYVRRDSRAIDRAQSTPRPRLVACRAGGRRRSYFWLCGCFSWYRAPFSTPSSA